MSKQPHDRSLKTTVRYNFYIRPELLAQLKAKADSERRSVSATICLSIEKYLNQQQEI
jgi:hypothetical protein